MHEERKPVSLTRNVQRIMYSICQTCNGRGITGVRPVFTYPVGYAPPVYAEAILEENGQVAYGPVLQGPPPAYYAEWTEHQRRPFRDRVSVPRSVDHRYPFGTITEESFERVLESVHETADMERLVRYLYNVETVPRGQCPVMKSWMVRALFRRCQALYCSSYIMNLFQSWDVPGRARVLNPIDTLLLMDIEDEWIRIDDEDDRIYASESEEDVARHVMSDSETSVSEVDMSESYVCFYCGRENVPGDAWCCGRAQYGPSWNVWPACSCLVCSGPECSDVCLRYNRLGYRNGRPVCGPVPEDVDFDDALRDFVTPDLEDGTVEAADQAFGQMVQREFDQDLHSLTESRESVVRRLLFD